MHIAIDHRIIIDSVEALIAGPAEGVNRQELIRMWSDTPGQQKKHILYALAQRALLEWEDHELGEAIHPKDSVISAEYGNRKISFTAGAVLYMAEGNRIGLHIHTGLNTGGLLRAFHRYATRMIRLDI